VVSGTFTTTFAYNGDGHRVAKAENGVTTSYVVAVLGLSQVLVETTGGQTTRYVYGHDLLAEHDGEAWAWHLNDGLGSVRQLADGNGDVTLAQGYTPFGVPLWSEGSGVTGYGFTGEQWEAYTGLLFLRARYYEPGMGRFASKDLWRGEYRHPLTLNSYLYGLSDPVNFLDYLGTNPHRGSIYSCNCGFIDNAHFDQAENSFAAEIIKKVREADIGSEFPLSLPNALGPIVQRTESRVKIKEPLSQQDQTEIALAIFQAMENKSEQGFGQWAFSSYDEEDLVSNLLSFYVALGGEYTSENIKKWCGYLSKEESIEVFDWYEQHLGFEQVKEWGNPRLATCAEGECGWWLWRHPCPEECPLDKYCPGQRSFPSDKFDAVPEPEGDKWEFLEKPSVRPSIEL